MLTAIFALSVGMVIGIFVAGTGKLGKEYDADTADWFIKDLENKLRLEHESVTRWKKLAVRQQAEIRAREFADELYPNAIGARAKVASLRFELQYIENQFTGLFSPASKRRMIEACEKLLNVPVPLNVAMGRAALLNNMEVILEQANQFKQGADRVPA